MSTNTNELYREVSSAFWGRGLKVDKATPLEVAKAKKLISNHGIFRSKLQKVSDVIRQLASEEKLPEEVVKDIPELVKSYKRVLSVYKDYGLWPSYDQKSFLKKHDEFLSLVKLAAEPYPMADNSVMQSMLKWSEVFPKIVMMAEGSLEKLDNKTYVNGLYRLINDTLLDENGVVTLVEKLAKILEVEEPEATPSESTGNEDTHKKIRWFGEKGMPQIGSALKALVRRKKPQNPEQAEQFDSAVAKITRGTALHEWNNRIRPALEEFGFLVTGVFDRKRFERKVAEFDSMFRLASGGSADSLDEMAEQVQGTYKAYLQARQDYSGDKKTLEDLSLHYHNIALSGDKSLYSELKKTHEEIGKIPVSPAPVHPPETSAEPTSPENKDVPQQSSDSTPTDGKDTEQQLVGDSPGSQSTGEDNPEVVLPINYEKLKGDKLVTICREEQSLAKGLAEYLIKFKVLSAYRAQTKWLNTQKANNPAYVKGIDNLVRGVFANLSNALQIPNEALGTAPVLEIAFKVTTSPLFKILNMLDAHVRDGSESAKGISDELAPLAAALSKFVVLVYNKVMANRGNAPTSNNPSVKEVDKKEVPSRSNEPSEQTPPPALMGQEPPKDKEDGAQETPAKGKVPQESVTPENVQEIVQGIVDKTEPEEEVPPEQVATLEQAKDIAQGVVLEKQEDLSEAKDLSKDLARKLMESLQMVSNEDSSVTIEFLSRALSAARETVNIEIGDASLKKDLLQATSGMLQKVSQGTTSEADKQELMEMLTSFEGELQGIITDHTEEIADMQKHLAVIRQKLLIHPLTGGDAKELSEALSQALDTTPVKEPEATKAPEPHKEYTPPSGDPRESEVHDLSAYLVGLPMINRSQATVALHDVLVRFRNDIDQEVIDRANLSSSVSDLLATTGRGASQKIDSLARGLLAGLVKLLEEEIPDFSTEERQTLSKAKQVLNEGAATIKRASVSLLHRAVALHFAKRASRGI